MHRIYIGIGSNLGDRRQNCEKSVQFIAQNPQIKLVSASNWHETEPVVPKGVKKEGYPLYINGVIEIETDLAPNKLHTVLKEIEDKMGRKREGIWAPRTIDLDILLIDDLIINTEDLRVPHPEVANRMFVLLPLSEIAPGLIHPKLNKTIRELRKLLE